MEKRRRGEEGKREGVVERFKGEEGRRGREVGKRRGGGEV